MLKNYLRTALRTLWKQKGFTAINLTGLALGMACSLLILLWVRDERGVDGFHAKGNRLFYVYEKNQMGAKLQSWYWTQGPLAEELKKDIPEVEGATAIASGYTGLFSVGDKKLKEAGFAAGPDFFSMFSYPLINGSGTKALSAPDGIAISRRMAVGLFGSADAAIGKTVRYNNKKDFAVRAVYEDFGPRVSYPGEFVMSWKGYIEDGNEWATGFAAVDNSTCVLLKAGVDPAVAEAKMRHLLDDFPTEDKKVKINLALQRFGDRYLHSDFDAAGVPTGGRIAYVRLFGLIALFILVIACINFMNLTTARSVKRAKEIGVRKVMGAVRGLLIRQFIGEAILMACFSAALALVLVAMALPAFNLLTGKAIVLPAGDAQFWVSLAGITLLTGLLSGSYPAFYLSGFNAIRVLKAALPSGTRGDALFRKGLVVFQFTLSIVLILATILITQQIDYMRNARLGYDRENLLYLPIEGEMGKKLGVLQTEGSRLPGVAQLTLFSGGSATSFGDGTLGINWTGKDPNETVRFIHESVGRDFLKTMKIELVAGRDFSADFPTDSNGVILNETALKLMGYKDPIGKTLKIYNYPLHIIGIVKDFHFQSLQETMLPLALFQGKNEWFSTVVIRTKPGQTRVALAGLEKLYRQLNPAFPFSYQFADAQYAALYKSEEVTGRLSVLFALLAISISCLGLLGLSLFTAEQRVREIGIRKVLGASVFSLFAMLSRSFLGLVGIAYLVAAPLGWWAMHQWLAGFAYRTTISGWTFVVAGLLAVGVALVTVGWQTLRAAGANPVRSLRSE
ncbi:MAG TPA: ABC transporter permease [Puia sp.]|uniref:ABC transporter permease n=1 Tax=Puia sp. TaxID=2045100 RepID=UPI002CD65A09|nr:ABC transporter permease [Puia sp.]HVU99505.1 ABC transporter permease [Puia sp.]